jgi:hypothetical protein
MRNEWVFLSERSVWWCDVIKGRKGKERKKGKGKCKRGTCGVV